MTPLQLPPLPEGDVPIWSASDNPPERVVRHLFSAYAAHADRLAVARAVIEQCAGIAKRNGEDEPYGHAKFRCAHIEAEITALLDGLETQSGEVQR